MGAGRRDARGDTAARSPANARASCGCKADGRGIWEAQKRALRALCRIFDYWTQAGGVAGREAKRRRDIAKRYWRMRQQIIVQCLIRQEVLRKGVSHVLGFAGRRNVRCCHQSVSARGFSGQAALASFLCRHSMRCETGEQKLAKRRAFDRSYGGQAAAIIGRSIADTFDKADRGTAHDHKVI